MSDSTELKTAATKIDAKLAKDLERVCRATGLKTADLLRIGLKRVIESFDKEGKIELGAKPARKAA